MSCRTAWNTALSCSRFLIPFLHSAPSPATPRLRALLPLFACRPWGSGTPRRGSPVLCSVGAKPPVPQVSRTRPLVLVGLAGPLENCAQLTGSCCHGELTFTGDNTVSPCSLWSHQGRLFCCRLDILSVPGSALFLNSPRCSCADCINKRTAGAGHPFSHQE